MESDCMRGALVVDFTLRGLTGTKGGAELSPGLRALEITHEACPNKRVLPSFGLVLGLTHCTCGPI